MEHTHHSFGTLFRNSTIGGEFELPAEPPLDTKFNKISFREYTWALRIFFFLTLFCLPNEVFFFLIRQINVSLITLELFSSFLIYLNFTTCFHELSCFLNILRLCRHLTVFVLRTPHFSLGCSVGCIIQLYFWTFLLNFWFSHWKIIS
jgi:hypothetical protein